MRIPGVGIAVAAALPAAERVACPVVADAHVYVTPWSSNRPDDSEAFDNFGAAPKLTVKGREYFALLQFDVSAAKGLTVEKATLRIRRDANPVPLSTVGISTISGNGGWAEGTQRGGRAQPGAVRSLKNGGELIESAPEETRRLTDNSASVAVWAVPELVKIHPQTGALLESEEAPEHRVRSAVWDASSATVPLTGAGAETKIVSWEDWDAHFGPLVDGSAFADLPRAGVPVANLYLNFRENWPSDLRSDYKWNDYPKATTTEEYRALSFFANLAKRWLADFPDVPIGWRTDVSYVDFIRDLLAGQVAGGEGRVPWNAIRGSEAWERAEPLTVFYPGFQGVQDSELEALRLRVAKALLEP